MLAVNRKPAAVKRLDPLLDLYVDAAMSLHWTRIAAGEQSDPERIVLLGRALFAYAEAPVSRARQRGSRGTS